MSADNFWFIRHVANGYLVTMEFASNGEPGPATDRISPEGNLIGGYTKMFTTREEAIDYTLDHYTEYGTIEEDCRDQR